MCVCVCVHAWRMAAGSNKRHVTPRLQAEPFPDRVRVFTDERAPLFIGAAEAVDQKAFFNDLANREARTQGAIWVLEYDLHFAPQGAEFFELKALDVAAMEGDVTLRPFEPNEGAAEGRFSGTRFAHHA